MTDELSYFLRWQVAAFSAGAAAIHFAETNSHFSEYWLFGAFFFAIAWLQVASIVGILTRPARSLVISVVIVNLVVIAIWVWSRTAGLPIGPEAGEPEAVGAPDVLATVLEGLLAMWALAVLVPRIGSRAASHMLGVASTAIVWIGVVAVTALVFFTTPETSGH